MTSPPQKMSECQLIWLLPFGTLGAVLLYGSNEHSTQKKKETSF